MRYSIIDSTHLTVQALQDATHPRAVPGAHLAPKTTPHVNPKCARQCGSTLGAPERVLCADRCGKMTFGSGNTGRTPNAQRTVARAQCPGVNTTAKVEYSKNSWNGSSFSRAHSRPLWSCKDSRGLSDLEQLAGQNQHGRAPEAWVATDNILAHALHCALSAIHPVRKRRSMDCNMNCRRNTVQGTNPGFPGWGPPSASRAT